MSMWELVKNSDDDKVRRGWAAMVLRILAELIERGENPVDLGLIKSDPDGEFHFIDYAFGTGDPGRWDVADVIGGSSKS